MGISFIEGFFKLLLARVIEGRYCSIIV